MNLTYSATPQGMFSSLFGNWSLILQMTHREIVGRYKGSVFGLLWSFLNPMIMLAVYTFVFSVVFKAKWGVAQNNKFEFAVILFCGLIVYNLFAECLLRAPTTVINNVMYVKKVVFPLEIFSWINILSALFHGLASFVILIIAYVVIYADIHWTIIFFPVVLLPFLFLIAGFSWALASLGVFIRDIGQAIGIIMSLMMFMSPIFYPITALPEKVQLILRLNPLTFIIEQSRKVVLWGEFPDWGHLSIYFAASLFIAWGGFFWFQKTRKGFADVL